MTTVNPTPQESITNAPQSKITRAVIWTAISALIASAVICVGWVLFGTQAGIITRAFLTVALLTGFAFATIWDVRLSENRPGWLNLVSMFGWIAILLAGAVKIWTPVAVVPDDYYYYSEVGTYAERVWQFIGIILIIRLAVLHFGLYFKSFNRNLTTFNKITGYTTVALVAILATLLVIPLVIIESVDFPDFYWRVTIAVSILAAVGTALVPLVNALTAPKKPSLTPAFIPSQPAGQLAWPTYNDGVTPLPVLPNGQPDFQAGYTGHPTYPVAQTEQPSTPVSTPFGDQAVPTTSVEPTPPPTVEENKN